MKRPKAVESSCPHNVGINCTGASAKCEKCGWNPKEHTRRNTLLRANGLCRIDHGLLYLDVSRPERKDA